jgi:hypothetical protein
VRNNLFTDLTLDQQEVILGGSSLAEAYSLIPKNANVRLPDIAKSSNLEADIDTGIRSAIKGNLP